MEWSTDLQVLSTLPVPHKSRLNTPNAPTLELVPSLIGEFSLDAERNFHHDKRSMSFISLDWNQSGSKSVDFDLNQSMDKVRRKNYSECRQDKLKNLLKWILLNKSKFILLDASQQDEYQQGTVLSHADKTTFRGHPSAFRRSDSAGPEYSSSQSADSITKLSTDFVCNRGMLQDIMCSPYDEDGWIILATKFRNTIYLSGAESAYHKNKRLKKTEREKQMCSWGYKFEHYMSVGSDPREGYDENKEYYCILRSRLAGHSLVYGAEVDGVDKSRYAPPYAPLAPFVELKTSKKVSPRTLLESKFLKWWSQSYLVGIPRVVCGFRKNDEGMVSILQSYEVSLLPGRSREYWSSNKMIDFLDRFLDWVKGQVVVDNPNKVYKLTRKPGSRTVMCQCLVDDSSVAFLPQWYVDKIFASET